MISNQRMRRRSFLSLSASMLAAPIIGSHSHASSGEESRRTIERDNALLTLPLVNPKIVVTKSRRMLQLYSNGRVVRTYRVGLGLSPVEDKIRAGDRRTPEGDFYICLKNSHSQFYLSLELSYPNQKHAERGLRDGLIGRAQYEQIAGAIKRKRQPPQNTPLGGEIFTHANRSPRACTCGCVALDAKDL